MEGFDQGYDTARFESFFAEDYQCPICSNVLKDPAQCQRNEHYFCIPCIKTHLQQNSDMSFVSKGANIRNTEKMSKNRDEAFTCPHDSL